MPSLVKLYEPAGTTVPEGGQSVVALYGPMSGGRITNPLTASGQGIPIVEVLYVSIVGPAAAEETATTIPLQPGQSFIVPEGQSGHVFVNAATSGHAFSAFVVQPVSEFTPPTGSFPPASPTSITKTIRSYLYKQYDDDEDLQAFVDWQNAKAQEFVDWFNATPLAVYTNDNITGDLLDWIAAGIYGFFERPALPSGENQNIGTFNTYAFDELTFNELKIVGSQNVYATTDDIFKRILTWHLYKADGKVATVRWLKRRVYRFLFGVNGMDVNAADTSLISVSFGNGNQVNITIGAGKRTATGGAFFDVVAFNDFAFNDLATTFEPSPVVPNALIFKAAVESGVLELPFQFDYVVNVG